MKIVFAYAAALGLALAMVACEATAPDRRANASAELDAFYGGNRSGFQVGAANTPVSVKPAPGGEVMPVVPGANDPALDWADTCASNLDELTGALLLYYSVNKALPPTLDQLPPLSPSGERISLTCPVSGKRYVYIPEGLKPPVIVNDKGDFQEGTLLILYDAEPSHQMVQHLTDGNNNYDLKKPARFGIVMEPRRAVLGQSVQMFVVPIEQNLLDMYLRNSRQTAPAPAPRPANGVW